MIFSRCGGNKRQEEMLLEPVALSLCFSLSPNVHSRYENVSSTSSFSVSMQENNFITSHHVLLLQLLEEYSRYLWTSVSGEWEGWHGGAQGITVSIPIYTFSCCLLKLLHHTLLLHLNQVEESLIDSDLVPKWF